MLRFLPVIEWVPALLIIPQWFWSGKKEWWKGLILPGITFLLACQLVYITPLRVLLQEWAYANIPTLAYLVVYGLRRFLLWRKKGGKKRDIQDLN